MTRLLTLLALTLVQPFVLADTALVQSPRRPSMEQLREQLDETPPPFQDMRALDISRWIVTDKASYEYFLDAVKGSGPRLVVEAEKRFPKATWAFIGRDGALLSDMFEAFYLSAGESDRVMRIGLSSASVVPYMQGQDPGFINAITDYLQRLGLNLPAIQKWANGTGPKPKPFVIVDTISKGNGRQMRSIYSAVLCTYIQKLGGKAEDLVGFFEMVGFQVSTTATQPPLAWGDVSAVQHSNRALLNHFGMSNPANLQSEATRYAQSVVIPVISDDGTRATEMGYEHFTEAWHGPYSALHSKGVEVVDTPGAIHHESTRKSILAMQKAMWKLVGSADFFTATARYAKEQGVSTFEYKLTSTHAQCHRVVNKANSSRGSKRLNAQ